MRGTVGAALQCSSGLVGMESLQDAGQGGSSGLAGERGWDREGGSDDREMGGAQRDAGGIAKAPSQTCCGGEDRKEPELRGVWPGRLGGYRTIEHNWADRRSSWSGGIHHGLGPGS